MEERVESVWFKRSHRGAELLKEKLEAQGKEADIRKRNKSNLTPELLWLMACEYFEEVDNNPLFKSEVIRGGDRAGEIVKVEAPRPYTWSGLDEHLFNKGVLADTVGVRYSSDPRYWEYKPVVGAIDAIMKRNKFEGAAVGLFNPMIIARDLGLSEKTQTESMNINLEQKIDYSKLSTEALEEIAALMEQKKIE